MNDIVDGADRCKTAGTQTGNTLNCKQPVGGHMILGLHTGGFVKSLLYIVGFSDMAGGAVADFYDILTLLVHGEVLIEGCDAVKLGRGFTDLVSHIQQGILGQELIFLLDILHNRYDFGFLAFILFEYAVDQLEIDLNHVIIPPI